MYAEAKISMETGGIDLIETTIDRWGSYNANGLLQPWDDTKADLNAYLPGMLDGEAGEMSRLEGALMILPSVWGTEALVASRPMPSFPRPPRGRPVQRRQPRRPAPAFDAGRHGALAGG